MMKKIIVFCRSFALIIGLLGLVCICASENVKKSVEDETADNNDDADNMETPSENPGENNSTTACARRQNSLVHDIKSAEPRQYPFVAAIMSQQSEYLCCGTVVSQGMILTSASCILLPISHVLLNATKDKGDSYAVLVHIVSKETFPTFPGGITAKDVGIIFTEKHNNTLASKLKVSNYTSASKLIDMTAIGFGLNAEVGKTRELQYVGVEHKPAYDDGDILRGYFDCIDSKALTCFRDMGGPIIFDNELVGIVKTGSNDCVKDITSQYSVNKVLVEVLPTYVFKVWLDERIAKNEADESSGNLTVYPAKPVSRNQPMSLKSTRNSGATYAPVSMLSSLFFNYVCVIYTAYYLI